MSQKHSASSVTEVNVYEDLQDKPPTMTLFFVRAHLTKHKSTNDISVSVCDYVKE